MGLDAHVVVATKGRPREVAGLVRWLSAQTVTPRSIVLVGVGADDVAGTSDAPERGLTVICANKAGSSHQRNVGIAHLASTVPTSAPFFVVFFDDDFRPANDWIERCGQVFAAQPDVAGVTGRVLADGVHGASLTDEDAAAYIAGKRSAERHWAGGSEPCEIRCVYGCNMAFRDRVVLRCRFDENLPLYGWQEDQDYTSQARPYGRTMYAPTCRGVHLGIRSGRVSGLRFGYSQIANPLYLMQKGTMPLRKGAWFALKAPLANSVKSLALSTETDYPGRFHGNVLALADIARGRCHPLRVLDLDARRPLAGRADRK